MSYFKPMVNLAALPERGVIAVEGEDRVSFLQGLVSNDVALVVPGRAVWAALLTPQGKWLADFFILTDGDRLLLDCENAQIPGLVQRLSRFRLRAKVSVRADDALQVHVAWLPMRTGGEMAARGVADEGAAPVSTLNALTLPSPGADAPTSLACGRGEIVAPDPRLPDAGWRILSPHPPPATASEADWNRHRLALGLPDGSRDLEAEKTILLEAGFDELDGVSWTKGCYMGQELTARTKYRGLLKRRLVPVDIVGALPEPGTPVFRGEQEVGAIRSGAGQIALAVLRLDALGSTLSSAGASVTPRIPAWMKLPT